MNLGDSVNDLVRKRIRALRKSKKLSMRETAERADMAMSSYAAIESGRYKINVNNLYLILGALEADITEVWPTEALAEELTGRKLFLVRQQEFRFQELLQLAGSPGGALLAETKTECSVLLKGGVSDYLLDRMALYLADGRRIDEGVFFSRKAGDITYHIFLNCERTAVKPWLIERYLTIWSAVFSDTFIFETAKKRQLQAG